MQSSVPLYKPDCAPKYTTPLPRSSRNAFRAQIAIHRLILLVALALLPLLTWHLSTSHVFEKIEMPKGWKEEFQKLQLPEWRMVLWVAAWILAAIDTLHALLCLGWYQELLHPRTGDSRRNEGNKRSDDSSLETETRISTESTTARPRWVTKLVAIYRRIRSWVTRHNVDKREASMYPGRTTRRSYHPFLQPVIIPLVRTVLLILYDAILISVLALHIYSFIHLISKREKFCDTNFDGTNKSRADDPALTETDEVAKTKAGCQWFNASITSAGGVASAVAAILAATHSAALVCRIFEVCSVWYTVLKTKRRSKDRMSQRKDAEPEWQLSPRHVDTQTRHDPASGRTGRLTQISEEEYDAGGVARRRHHKSRSAASGTSNASSTKLENVLLECLVP